MKNEEIDLVNTMVSARTNRRYQLCRTPTRPMHSLGTTPIRTNNDQITPRFAHKTHTEDVAARMKTTNTTCHNRTVASLESTPVAHSTHLVSFRIITTIQYFLNDPFHLFTTF